jgi:multidrug resistance efflux pump
VRFNALAATPGGQAANGIASAEASAGWPSTDQQSTATSLTAELDRLAELHASGVLTDAEFQTAKAKLLRT